MKKVILTATFFAATAAVYANDAASAGSSTSMASVILVVMAVLIILVLFLVMYLSNAVSQLESNMRGKPAPGFWAMLFSLKPLEEEAKLEIADHDFDGIKELSNPIPPWFNALFYGTIVFGIVYFIAYHVVGFAPLQDDEYKNELMVAEAKKNEYLAKVGNNIDENSVTLLTDAASIDAGKQDYVAKCAACHGQMGEGGVGPNLTDKYWLHGGSVSDIFKVIKYGVPAKGMVAWQSSINPVRMQQITSYILSLQGTAPAGGKEPQGNLYESNEPTASNE
jgi:cytochrome c oxidase cbb3-type subunit 3